jgi:hypothetical protein
VTPSTYSPYVSGNTCVSNLNSTQQVYVPDAPDLQGATYQPNPGKTIRGFLQKMGGASFRKSRRRVYIAK